VMLKVFEVSNFKSFDEWFVFDFSRPSEYQFNADCVKSGVINKALVYGINGCGKSNLGFAILDIVGHLTDNNSDSDCYENYTNAYNKSDLAEFKYTFQFGGYEVVYCYGKQAFDVLVYETLYIDGEVVVQVDRRNSDLPMVNLRGAESLKLDSGDLKISIIKYIKNNTFFDLSNEVTNAFSAFMSFVEGMLFFRSLGDNNYLGYQTGNSNILADIVSRGNLDAFETFLNEAGIDCQLEQVERNGKPNIVFLYKEEARYFYDVASTGTKSLALFYYWWQQLTEEAGVSFVFVDEFDAYYHHELSALIVRHLKEISPQVVLTTHNTSIMTNDLLRPDCYFVMNNQEIKALSQCTEKDLRFAHNLEKMYKAGQFDAE